MKQVHEFRVQRHPALGIEIVCARSARRFDRHTHEQFGIGIVTEGAQRSASCAGQVEAQRGDVITVHPAEVHDGASLGPHARAWQMLYLDPDLVADIALDRTEGAGTDYEFRSPVVRSPNLFSQCAQVLGQAATASSSIALESLLITILGDARRYQDRAPSQHGATPSPGIARALSLMRDTPGASISLAELARQADLSRHQLIRGVRAATGLTPHAYLVQCRVHMARRLIREGVPLIDTAQACGFTDQSHLNRAFVRRFGLTPGAYAKASSAARA
ncbi:MAG: AraC family transcriptional regulator [Pseudomonadota bacterium]